RSATPFPSTTLFRSTRLAGAELGPFGIRVNAISPGAIATPIFWGGSARARTLSDEENQQKMAKLQRNLANATPTPRARWRCSLRSEEHTSELQSREN